MAFNRFELERLEELIVIHFGLVTPSGMLLDRYSAAIFKAELLAQKESVMDYLGKTGSLGDAPPGWQSPSIVSPIDLFNMISVSSNPFVAETTLNNIVARTIIDQRTGAHAVIPSEPVALLRSTLELQKHLIVQLYPRE